MRRTNVYGPYPHGRKWKIIVDRKGAGRTSRLYDTEAEALAIIQGAWEKLGLNATSIGEAVDAYEREQRDRGNKLKSFSATTYRLKTFFAGTLDSPLSRLSPSDCERLYADLTTRPSRTGRPFSVDSHRNMLAEAKTFLAWCVEKSFVKKSPLAHVKGKGLRSHGKPQLRFDEARAWDRRAIELAGEGEAGAVAALLTVVMGMRCSEIVSRQVRDLDDGGQLLWIPASKTRAGKRTLKVPKYIRPFLLDLADGKASTDLLFGYHDRAWPRLWVKRICRMARVPEVCAHAMRGLHSSMALVAGDSPETVARSMGHESSTTTLESYAAPDAVATARQEAALRVLAGGKR